MLRAVVDVNVLVSAAIGRDGPPARIVRACLAGTFELIVSPMLVAELDRVLGDRRLASRISPLDLDRLRQVLEHAAIQMDDPEPERVVGADPGDDYLVALARVAGARVIVTGDHHLLELDGLQPPALEPAAFLGVVERLP